MSFFQAVRNSCPEFLSHSPHGAYATRRVCAVCMRALGRYPVTRLHFLPFCPLADPSQGPSTMYCIPAPITAPGLGLLVARQRGSITQTDANNCCVQLLVPSRLHYSTVLWYQPRSRPLICFPDPNHDTLGRQQASCVMWVYRCAACIEIPKCQNCSAASASRTLPSLCRCASTQGCGLSAGMSSSTESFGGV